MARADTRFQSDTPARAAGLSVVALIFPMNTNRDRLAIDLINGSELLREWVDDQAAQPPDLDALTESPMKPPGREEREEYLIYQLIRDAE